jgi:hypothetical protein
MQKRDEQLRDFQLALPALDCEPVTTPMPQQRKFLSQLPASTIHRFTRCMVPVSRWSGRTSMSLGAVTRGLAA